MKIYSETKIYEGLGYTPENVEEIESRAREEGTAAGATDGYNDGYESGRTDYKQHFSKEYFTIEALSTGTLDIYLNSANTLTGSLFYKINDDEYWTALRTSSETGSPSDSITLAAGDVVKFKGTLDNSNKLFKKNNSFPMKVYGNIQSLYFDDAFSGETTCKEAKEMFNDSFLRLIDASNLVLPATTLTYGCYSHMFHYCQKLTAAPALPATTLANRCYMGMFSNCTGLTAAPELPATTLVEACYMGMFAYCTSLTTAPVLPATLLDKDCYFSMFYGCTNLSAITCLATDISSAGTCTPNWVYGVSSTGTFTKDASMTSWPTGVNGIPDGWTVIDAE